MENVDRKKTAGHFYQWQY